jgi:hypothetical protein
MGSDGEAHLTVGFDCRKPDSFRYGTTNASALHITSKLRKGSDLATSLRVFLESTSLLFSDQLGMVVIE